MTEDDTIEEYMSRIKNISFCAHKGDKIMEVKFSPDTRFSFLVECAEAAIKSGFTEYVDFFANYSATSSSMYLISKENLESAIDKYVSEEKKSEILQKIYKESDPAMAMYACELILETKGIYLQDGYLSLD